MLTEAQAMMAVGGMSAGGSAARGISGKIQAKRMQQRQMAFAREQMSFASLEAAANRQFQREMSDTQYQRSVKDMKAAGLNPMMMYGGGASVGSSPSGSQAAAGSGISTPTSDFGPSGAVGSALAAKELRKRIQEMEQNISLSKATEMTEAARRIKILSESKTYLGRLNAEVEGAKEMWKSNEAGVKKKFKSFNKFVDSKVLELLKSVDKEGQWYYDSKSKSYRRR